MKKNRLWHILTGIIFLTWGIMFLPGISHAEENSFGAVLILTDVSGSMQDPASGFEITDQEGRKQEKRISKSEAAKELVVQITNELSEKSCKFGIYTMCYKAGFKELYSPFLSIDNYNAQEIKDIVTDKFITKYPVFNRRTPIADTLRQLDENEFKALNGSIRVLIISDGKESFYDLEKDKNNTQTQDEKVIGPLTETRRLKEKYGQALSIYTVFMEDVSDKDKKDKPQGAVLLEDMASASAGKYFAGKELLENKSQIDELVNLLCSSIQ
ncbi:von Willebrand factor A domain-containing protein [Desulfonema limicola]|uniref:von Willebrand factor A domain-containing protein n=1 Tax=Desulfonema limicola TaxID=45656 RepID=A0A975B6J9_9BACT|nr:vWA domain-containing protein [Desulfonema limicola]QTA79700.1 von Willebrand factor A domain-containing protein [Desulfonema limicola]